jgi:hypothetical protein
LICKIHSCSAQWWASFENSRQPAVIEQVIQYGSLQFLRGICLHPHVGAEAPTLRLNHLSKPAVPWCVEFPAYDWDRDLERFRKEIEAAGKR